MDVPARVTSKGQITLPKVVRDALGLEPGDAVLFRVVDGHALLARTPDLLELAGSIPVPAELRGVPWEDPGACASRAGRALSVTVLLDTNVLVRHLTGDPPDQALGATAFLESRIDLWLADLVVAELVYVLRSFYGSSRNQVASLIRAVLEFPAVSVSNAQVLYRSLQLFEAEGLDFAETYLVALAEASAIGQIASFARSLDRVPSVTRVEP